MTTDLAISKNFRLRHDYEVVWLEATHGQVFVGDHYGDPALGLIDEVNGWCASFGEGAVIYRLKQPYQTYLRGENSGQWSEWGRGSAPYFVTHARQTGPFEVEVYSDSCGENVYRVLRFDRSEAGIVEAQPVIQADR